MVTILVDKDAEFIEAAGRKVPALAWGQLRTPLTGYKNAVGRVKGIDNGCFSSFREAAFRRLLEEYEGNPEVLFVALPDRVGDCAATRLLYDAWRDPTLTFPRAYVLQDGQKSDDVPWDDIAAIFLGGSDHFKDGPEALNLVMEAKARGLWVHIGRAIGAKRLRRWANLADSVDGSNVWRDSDFLTLTRTLLKCYTEGGLFNES